MRRWLLIFAAVIVGFGIWLGIAIAAFDQQSDHVYVEEGSY